MYNGQELHAPHYPLTLKDKLEAELYSSGMQIIMYKKFDFGKELAEKVHNKYDITYLSNWAHRKYLDHVNQLDDETEIAIMTVIAMDEGDEFIRTEEELLKLAADLQQDTWKYTNARL